MEEMESLLPSKKIIAFFIVALVLGGGFLALAELGSQTQVAQQNDKVVEQNKARLQGEKDTDGDGLKDWEEMLWKTDPHNPDTDGDGTPDGQEVAENRDPTIAGPDDALPEPVPDTSQTTPNASPTKTNSLTQQVLQNYLLLQRSGGASEREVQNLISQSASSIFEPQVTLYTRNDISVSTNNSEESLRAYTNAVGQVFANNRYGSSDPETKIIKEAILAADSTRLKELGPVIEIYENIKQNLLDIEAPEAVVGVHLDFLNNFSRITKALHETTFFFEDPVRGLGGIGAYQESALDIGKTIRTLKIMLVERDIVFTSKEAGYGFFE